MCTSIILGVAQLGLNMASSYMQYKQQKETVQRQEKAAKQQAQQQQQYLQAQTEKIEQEKETQQEQFDIENTQQQLQDRQEQSEIRANAGASGVEMSGSNYDYLNQMENQQQLNNQSADLNQQNNLNDFSWQLEQTQYQKDKNDMDLKYDLASLDAKEDKNIWNFGSSITGQILGGIQSLV